MSAINPTVMISESGGVVRLALHAQPGAKRNAVVGMHGDALKIAVSAPPVDGKANHAIEAVVAESLGVPARSVTVVAGHTSRRKTVSIEGVSLAEVERRLTALLASLSAPS